MESGDVFTIEDSLTMIRLWNTIDVCRLGPTDKLYQRYSDKFFPGYVEPLSKNLHALPTKGMALYSKDYDIYIGGRPHANSQYLLKIK